MKRRQHPNLDFVLRDTREQRIVFRLPRGGLTGVTLPVAVLVDDEDEQVGHPFVVRHDLGNRFSVE